MWEENSSRVVTGLGCACRMEPDINIIISIVIIIIISTTIIIITTTIIIIIIIMLKTLIKFTIMVNIMITFLMALQNLNIQDWLSLLPMLNTGSSLSSVDQINFSSFIF